jgi:hypothetical protein
VPIATDAADADLSAIRNTGIAAHMYVTRCAMTDFSSNGVQQLKGYFSNKNDSYIFAAFGFFFYLCSTPTMLSRKCKMKMSHKSQYTAPIPNIVKNNYINLHFCCVSLKISLVFLSI